MENTQSMEKVNKSKHLSQIFQMLRKRDEIFVMEKKGRFNKTELRLLNEVATAQKLGNPIISTQLATRLGVTRSAVSQIVNRLEEQGVLRRVAAQDDKKIAYVEIDEKIVEIYKNEIEKSHTIIEEIVKEFGEKKFEQLSALYGEFMDLMSQYVAKIKKSCKCKQ